MNDMPKAPAPFDAVAWREQLLELNPWARGLTIDGRDEAFAAAQQQATLERHARGKEVWNDWANGMLLKKSMLQEVGGWAANTYRRGENADTRLWLALAAAVFSTEASKHTFDDVVQFGDFVFPSDAWFAGATFSADARFERATFSAVAVFAHATFSADASFRGATFSAVAGFEGATFFAALFAGANFSAAWFPDATFSTSAVFEDATFSIVVVFVGATFSADARFERATFSAAWFERATFSAGASFRAATFKGGTHLNSVRFRGPVDLAQAMFKGPVRLDGSVFEAGASFEAINSEAAFSLAGVTFRRHVPSFIGAAFKGTLRLDNVATPRYRLTFGWTPDRDASAHFRELKRRAEEAHDRDRELEFFAQEIRTGRFHASALLSRWRREAAPEGTAQRRVWLGASLPRWERVALPTWVPKVWSWRFWFGLAYGALSNFGRSLWRPALVWLALLLGFAVFYLGQHEDQHQARKARKPDSAWARVGGYVATARAAWANPPTCIPKGDKLVAGTTVVSEALFLSASNALVVFSIGRGDTSRRTYGCLYGFEGNQQGPPIVPYRVAVASTLQTLASAALIFLFLLAVRNLLRLK